MFSLQNILVFCNYSISLCRFCNSYINAKSQDSNFYLLRLEFIITAFELGNTTLRRIQYCCVRTYNVFNGAVQRSFGRCCRCHCCGIFSKTCVTLLFLCTLSQTYPGSGWSAFFSYIVYQANLSLENFFSFNFVDSCNWKLIRSINMEFALEVLRGR